MVLLERYDVYLTNVNNMIEDAFSNDWTNINFKMIQTILLILAKALDVLQREVSVDSMDSVSLDSFPHSDKITVTARKVIARKRKMPHSKTTSATKSGQPTILNKHNVLGSNKKTGLKATVMYQNKQEETDELRYAKELKLWFQRKNETLSTDEDVLSDGDESESADKINSSQYRTSKLIDEILENVRVGTKTGNLITSFPGPTRTSIEKAYKKDDQREKHSRIIHSSETEEVHQETVFVVTMSSSSKKPTHKGYNLANQAKTISEPVSEQQTHGSLATQEEYLKLKAKVSELEQRFRVPVSGSEEFMVLNDLQKRRSVSDPIAILQLSSRLETIEKTLATMFDRVQRLANKHRVSAEKQYLEHQDGKAEDQKPLHLETEEQKLLYMETLSSKISGKSIKFKESLRTHLFKQAEEDNSSARYSPDAKSILIKEPDSLSSDSRPFIEISKMDAAAVSKTSSKGLTRSSALTSMTSNEMHQDKADVPFVIPAQLRTNTHQFHKELMTTATKKINELMSKIANIENHIKMAAMDMNHISKNAAEIDFLEERLKEYGAKVNKIDAEISAKIDLFQEEIENMIDVWDNALEDKLEKATKENNDIQINEIFNHIPTIIQTRNKLEDMQRELNVVQRTFCHELKRLCNMLKVIENAKISREEMKKALEQKIGLEALNGRVNIEYFSEVHGHFIAKLNEFHNMINIRERGWQRAIDELTKLSNYAATKEQLEAFDIDLKNNITKLRESIESMANVISNSDPLAKRSSRNLAIEKPCVSCYTPNIPVLKKKKSLTKTKSDSEEKNRDHDICYPGKPVTHPIDPRTKICRSFCGAPNIIEKCLENDPDVTNVASCLKVKAFNPKDNSEIERQITDFVVKPCNECNLITLNNTSSSIWGSFLDMKRHSISSQKSQKSRRFEKDDSKLFFVVADSSSSSSDQEKPKTKSHTCEDRQIVRTRFTLRREVRNQDLPSL